MSNSLRPHWLYHARLLSITNSWSLLKLTSIILVMPSNHLILSSPSPPAFNFSQHQSLFQRTSSHQVAKVLELQIQHQSFQWIFGLISFRIDWLDLLAVQGTIKRFLQCHSLKASTLWCSAFFMVQFSHPYMTTELVMYRLIHIWIRSDFIKI